MSRHKDWLSVVGNLTIVLSLLFVGYQIQQERQLTAAQLQMQTWLSLSAWQAAMMGENPSSVLAKAVVQPESITVEEIEVGRWYVASYVDYLNHFSRLNQLGLGPGYRYNIELAARSAGADLGRNPLTRALVAELQNDYPWYQYLLEATYAADPGEQKKRNAIVFAQLQSNADNAVNASDQ